MRDCKTIQTMVIKQKITQKLCLKLLKGMPTDAAMPASLQLEGIKWKLMQYAVAVVVVGNEQYKKATEVRTSWIMQETSSRFLPGSL